MRLAAIIPLLAPPILTCADPSAMSGGGNFCVDEVARSLSKGETPQADAMVRALQAAGGRLCRLNYYAYWIKGQPRTDNPGLEYLIKCLSAGGITPVLFLEHYGNLPGSYDKWFTLGKAFAGMLRPNSPYLVAKGITDWGVTVYSAINEPDGQKDRGMARTKMDEALKEMSQPGEQYDGNYHDALEGLADGVHSIDPALKVVPGGLLGLNRDHHPTCHGFGPAIADLLNNGKLDGIDLHTYNDNAYAPIVKYDGQVYWDFSPQADFDAFKGACGISRDINFYPTEYGFKANIEQGGAVISPEEAAKRLLTCIWANLGVVKTDGTPATQYALVWNLFHNDGDGDARKDPVYGMCSKLSPWTPNPKGKTWQMVMRLTQGMAFTKLDPKGRGEFILEGQGNKMWVWQNYPKWSSIAGTSYVVEGIPLGARQLFVHDWDSWDQPERIIPLQPEQTSLKVDGLRERETYMFTAS